MPHLARITIYPIKSLDGQDVASARVLPSGAIEFDRRFAFVDRDGQFVNAKRTARLHAIRSAVDLAGRKLEVADASEVATFALDEDREEVEKWFSQRLLERVRLVEDAERGFPDDTDAPGPTVISTATLETVADWFGLTLDDVRRRFRANLEIGGVEPFWEDRLYARASEAVPFNIGPLKLLGTNPCQRCPVPSRDPVTGNVLPQFAKTFARERERTLPQWAESSRFDHYYRLAVNTRPSADSPGAIIKIGDIVEIE
jgi:uncharacterized protein YcbX